MTLALSLAPSRDAAASATADSFSAAEALPAHVLLTIVVPTFNERDNLRELVRRVGAALGPTGWEIIVVDDDSPDGTHALAKSIARRDPRVRCIRRIGRRGLAGACIEGMLASSAAYVAVIDGDLQHDEAILPQMLERLRAGDVDIVVGSRHVEGGGADQGFNAMRKAISDGAIRLAQITLGTQVRDSMSGFFMIRRDVAEELAPRLCTEGFKILADILATGGARLRTAEMGYQFRARLAGDSKLDAKVALDFIGLLLNKATGGAAPVSFVSFALVGLSGVLVHFLVLGAAFGAGLPFVAAQAIATACAIVSNFNLNNLITYRSARLRGREWLRGLALFALVCSVSALANVGVAAWMFERSHGWAVAGLAGVLMGVVWNYAISTKFVWRK